MKWTLLIWKIDLSARPFPMDRSVHRGLWTAFRVLRLVYDDRSPTARAEEGLPLDPGRAVGAILRKSMFFFRENPWEKPIELLVNVVNVVNAMNS